MRARKQRGAKGGESAVSGADASPPDMVNYPPHYTQHPSGVECITVTEHFNFCLGNAVKYIWRHSEKGGVEDLKKARWYLAREITRLEKASGIGDLAAWVPSGGTTAAFFGVERGK